MGKCSSECCNHQHLGEERRKIYLTLEDDSQLKCDVIDMFELNSQKYIAVLPVESETALLYRFTEDDGGIQLSNIESDEEYIMAGEAFMSNNNHNHIIEN